MVGGYFDRVVAREPVRDFEVLVLRRELHREVGQGLDEPEFLAERRRVAVEPDFAVLGELDDELGEFLRRLLRCGALGSRLNLGFRFALWTRSGPSLLLGRRRSTGKRRRGRGNGSPLSG